jgi:hypothetical protein
MPTKPNKKLVIAHRRRQVMELYLKGWTQSAIADHLTVRQKTISTDLKAIEQTWRASNIRDFDLLREEELRKLRMIEVEAWAGFERSQKPQQEARVKEGDQAQAVKTMKSRNGDPRFLALVLQCNAARRDLLGLDSSQPLVEVNNTVGPNLAELRKEMLHDPAYVEFCRQRALDADSGPVRPNQQSGPLADGAAPSVPGPSGDGHDPG